jgi:hypothetical protein
VAGMPDYGTTRGARASFEPRHGKARQAGTSLSSQTALRSAGGSGARPTRTSERYGFNRNACTNSSIKADLALRDPLPGATTEPLTPARAGSD